MTIAILDCGSGNLRSVSNAFARVLRETGGKTQAQVTDRADPLRAAERIVLPGVGAFAACKHGLAKQEGLVEALEERVLRDGVPFLGICVGMQLLAEVGREIRLSYGLDWLGGEVVRIPDGPGIRIPHMGWNTFTTIADHPLFAGVAPGDHAYFVHSYAYHPEDPGDIVATVEHGGAIVAAVGRDNIAGTQFHPEKSQTVGLRILANFLLWNP